MARHLEIEAGPDAPTGHALRPAVAGMAVIAHGEISAEARERIEGLLQEGSSKNTTAAYRSAMRYWIAWHELVYGLALTAPVPLATVLQFIGEHTTLADETPQPSAAVLALQARGLRRDATAAWSLATLRLHLAALARWQADQAPPGADWISPTQLKEVRILMHRIAVAYRDRKSQRVRAKSAATLDVLELMVATCRAEIDAPPLADARAQRQRLLTALRDEALLRFGWSSGGRRRSEIASAVYDYLNHEHQGAEPRYSYELTKTKTNQAGERKEHAGKPITGQAAVALAEWLRHTGIRSGPLFRGVRNGELCEKLTGRTVARIVQRRAQLAGVPGDWSGHSLRSGFITEANNSGIPIAETMKFTDHRTPSMVTHYHRLKSLLDAPAGNLAERKKNPR